MLVTPFPARADEPAGFRSLGLNARLLVAEAALRVPEYRTDAELAEDVALVLRHSRDPHLRDMAERLHIALAVSRPHTPPERTAR